MQDRLAPERERLLIERALHQPEAFQELYRHYLPRVYAYIAYRVGKEQDAEDLTSITAVEQHFRWSAFNTSLTVFQVRGYTASSEWNAYGGKPVGVSATIETVQFGGLTGQYVRGGWYPDTSWVFEAEPGDTITYEAKWDPMLRYVV